MAAALSIGSAAEAQNRFGKVPVPSGAQIRRGMDDFGRVLNGAQGMYFGYQGYRMLPPVPPGCCLGRQTTPYMVRRGQPYYYRGY